MLKRLIGRWQTLALNSALLVGFLATSVLLPAPQAKACEWRWVTLGGVSYTPEWRSYTAYRWELDSYTYRYQVEVPYTAYREVWHPHYLRREAVYSPIYRWVETMPPCRIVWKYERVGYRFDGYRHLPPVKEEAYREGTRYYWALGTPTYLTENNKAIVQVVSQEDLKKAEASNAGDRTKAALYNSDNRNDAKSVSYTGSEKRADLGIEGPKDGLKGLKPAPAPKLDAPAPKLDAPAPKVGGDEGGDGGDRGGKGGDGGDGGGD